MILDVLNMGSELGVLLKQKVSQQLYDFFTGINTSKGSLPRQGNNTKIYTTLLATDDLPRDFVQGVAKAVEVKLAMDVKSFLQQSIKETPQEVTIGSIMRSIPVTVLNKGAGAGDSITEIMRDKMNAVVSNQLELQESIQYEIERDAIQFSDVYVSVSNKKSILVGEAQNSSLIIDRDANPTYVNCLIHYITGRGEIKNVEFTISVEVVPRYVDRNELRVRLNSYSSRNFYRDFVAVEKGEKNFLLDWMLDLKTMKYKAKAAATGGMDIFSVIDKYRLLNDMGVNVYPFVCLLISSDFADELMTKENLNIKTEAKTIMKKMFMMGMFEYDQDRDIMNILYDGDRGWRKCSGDDITRDTDKYAKELKQLIKFNR